MGYLKTITVKNKKTGQESNINEEDFNEDLHEKLHVKRGARDNAADKLLERVLDASTLEEVEFVDKLVAETPGEERDPKLLNALFEQRRRFTTGPRRSQVNTTVDHGDPVEYEPYLAPKAHNQLVAKDQGDAGVVVTGTLETATDEELTSLEQQIAERREKLKAAKEDEGDEPKGDGSPAAFDVTEVTVPEARDRISRADAKELKALEKAENAGAKRVGVISAIEERREQLKAE